MKIAYIFTATGKYSNFIDELVVSGTKNFFPKEQVEFIVFTDDKSYIGKYPNLRVVHQNKLGWPFDTLMRFHFMDNIKDSLDHDYLFFGNANMSFYSEVAYEVLPLDTHNYLVGSAHPMQNQQPKERFSYERSKSSLAYVPFGGEGDCYYQGCFFGGRRDAFSTMVSELKRRVQVDLDNEVIAVWHDESHMNRYFIDNKPKTLHPGYVYPQDIPINYEKKIIQLNKHNFGGHEFLRNN